VLCNISQCNHFVKLSESEIEKLNEITHNGKASAKTIMHANILLKTDNSAVKKKNNREIAEIFNISANTVRSAKNI